MPLNLKLLAILFFSTGFNVIAQFQETPASYRNNFWNYSTSKPDSALIYARKLAEKPEYAAYLKQALHNELFVYLLESTRQKMKEKVDQNNHEAWEKDYNNLVNTCYTTAVSLYKDTSLSLSKSAAPLYLFAEVQRYSTDPAKLAELTKTFIHLMRSQKGLYQNQSATYALLIYKTIEHKKMLEQLSDELLSVVIQQLSIEMPSLNVYTSSNALLEERAWYRYLYASANHFKASKLARNGDRKTALSYFKTAVEYNPDLTDLDHAIDDAIIASVFFDQKQLDSYTPYLNLLKKTTTDKKEALAVLSKNAVRNPIAFKNKLHSFYSENFPKEEAFEIFWSKQINAHLKKVPDFTIQGLDGKVYSSVLPKGKWMIIDFWGTWCAPCLEEHPDLQKFHLSNQSSFNGKLELLTVACKDTKEKVNAYMAEFNYSFPVAMSDLKITKLFHVNGYPTKILISPEGNYLEIPLNVDWVNFVKQYISL